MGDYSYVNDQNGQICGIWLRDPTKAQDQYLLATILTAKGANHLLDKKYRIVPNHVDSKGGCFVIFGDGLAPGEQAQRPSSKPSSAATQSKRPWWKFWA